MRVRAHTHVHTRKIFAYDFAGSMEQLLPSPVKNSNLIVTAFTGRSNSSPDNTGTWQSDNIGFVF